MRIAEIEINPADHAGNTPAQRAAVFAHLTGQEKEDAVAKLEKAVKPKATTDPVKPPQNQNDLVNK